MRTVVELRNNIRTLGLAEHRLLKLHAYLIRHPELTGTRKLCRIYYRLTGFLENLDARFNTITAEDLDSLCSFGSGARAKRIFRENHYPAYYSDKPRPWNIKDDRLYTFYVGGDGYVGSGTYSPALMTARDLADHITRGVNTPAGEIQAEIQDRRDEIRQRDYIALDPIDLLPF